MGRICFFPKIINPINEKDFQPISILPELLKIYEKVILKQLSDYIERTSIQHNQAFEKDTQLNLSY